MLYSGLIRKSCTNLIACSGSNISICSIPTPLVALSTYNYNGHPSSLSSFNYSSTSTSKKGASKKKKSIEGNEDTDVIRKPIDITPKEAIYGTNTIRYPVSLTPTRNKVKQQQQASQDPPKQQVVNEIEEVEEDDEEIEEKIEIEEEEKIEEAGVLHKETKKSKSTSSNAEEDQVYQALNKTPAMQQYYHFKSIYPNHILLFRLGDFYEMFHDDAITVSNLLHITLTTRGIKSTGKDSIPMCGFPYHAAETYIEKLIRQGKTVAICDQLETPQTKSKGKIIKRDVVRVVTPGTVFEDRYLQPFQNNYLLSIYPVGLLNNQHIYHDPQYQFSSNHKFIMAWLDLSTGQFYSSDTTYDSLASEINRINPSELLIPKILKSNQNVYRIIKQYHLTEDDIENYLLENNRPMFKEAYNIEQDIEEIQTMFSSFDTDQLGVAGSILTYVYKTQLGKIPHIYHLQKFSSHTSMFIDFSTRNSLELTKTFQNTRKGSLLDILDKNLSSAGSRLLYHRLQSPSLSITEINHRLDLVEYFYNRQDLIKEVRKLISKCYDLERNLQRVFIDKSSPRDLAAIGATLANITILKSLILKQEESKKKKESSSIIKDLLNQIADFEPLLNELSMALIDNPPITKIDGGFIQKGYSKELDQFLTLRDNSKDLIDEVQQKYRSMLSIPSLKIKHNQIIGYFFEIQSAYRSKIPSNFIHIQTLLNHMRFKSKDLIELEEKINRAQSQALNVELQICDKLCKMIINDFGDQIKEASQILATIDISCTFGLISKERNYTRPILSNEPIINIKGGRHPTVEVAQIEKTGSMKSFTSNDCTLDSSNNSLIWLITGPNMGGKSTFLRQNALISIMAQIGCFVPAESAKIGIVDCIFSRVGSSDDLANDKSTFMVEMVETAAILKRATPSSFVIMDEVGRGTSMLDGLAIAQAVIEHLYHSSQCRTLFATHHHELTDLSKSLPKLECHTLAVVEDGDDLIFTHKIVPGVTNKSYGIFCAKLSGMPISVITRSQEILEQIDRKNKK